MNVTQTQIHCGGRFDGSKYDSRLPFNLNIHIYDTGQSIHICKDKDVPAKGRKHQRPNTKQTKD